MHGRSRAVAVFAASSRAIAGDTTGAATKKPHWELIRFGPTEAHALRANVRKPGSLKAQWSQAVSKM